MSGALGLRALNVRGLRVVAAALIVLLGLGTILFADDALSCSGTAIDLRARLTPPFSAAADACRLLGADHLGRDLLPRLASALRLSLILAGIATVLSASIGAVLGLVSAYGGRAARLLVDACIDAQAALPFFVVALGALAIAGQSVVVLVLVLGLHGWERSARVTRNAALSADRRGYADALRFLGAGPLRIYGLHILPNIVGILIVNASLTFSEAILLESALSFMGLGVQPPAASLGTLVGGGRDYILTAPWLVVAPGLLIFSIVLMVASFGDALQRQFGGANRLDPSKGKAQ